MHSYSSLIVTCKCKRGCTMIVNPKHAWLFKTMVETPSLFCKCRLYIAQCIAPPALFCQENSLTTKTTLLKL